MAIRWPGLVPALLLVVGTSHAEDKDVKLDGTWKVMKLEAGGQSAPEDLVKEARMIFKGDKVTVKGVSDRERESSFKTDAKQKPMQIDIVRGDRVTKGIFKLEGEMLTICTAQRDGERPSEFKSPEGSRTMLIILKKEK